MHKAVYSNQLMSLFKQLDKRLITKFYNFNFPPGQFDIVAMGGTALGLLNLKQVSKDIDLFIQIGSMKNIAPNENAIEVAERLANFIREHFDGSEEIGIDVSYEGIRGWNLMGFKVRTCGYFEFDCFKLYILHPLDLCITKVPRFSPEDTTDIEVAIKFSDATPVQLERRFYEYLNQLRNPREVEISRANFEKLKAINSQFSPNPRRWWQFWRW